MKSQTFISATRSIFVSVVLIGYSLLFIGTQQALSACTCVCHDDGFVVNNQNSAASCEGACNTRACPSVPGGKCTMDATKSTCDDPPPGATGGGTDSACTKEVQGVTFPCDPLEITGNIKDKPKTIIKNTILLALKFAGAGAFLLSLYAGFIIMFARGEAKKVADGKKIIIYAVVGLIVILLSYLMLNLIFSVLQKAVT